MYPFPRKTNSVNCVRPVFLPCDTVVRQLDNISREEEEHETSGKVKLICNHKVSCIRTRYYHSSTI